MSSLLATLTDAGAFGVWSIGGRQAHAALAATGQRWSVGAVVGGPLGETWGTAPDEVLLVTPAALDGQPAATLRSNGALVTQVGAGLVHLRLSGPGAASVLEAACPVDLSDRALAPGALAQVSLAGMRSIVIRETGSAPSYRIIVQRDLAVSLRDALVHLGAEEPQP